MAAGSRWRNRRLQRERRNFKQLRKKSFKIMTTESKVEVYIAHGGLGECAESPTANAAPAGIVPIDIVVQYIYNFLT